jgi:hypothetical protein
MLSESALEQAFQHEEREILALERVLSSHQANTDQMVSINQSVLQSALCC